MTTMIKYVELVRFNIETEGSMALAVTNSYGTHVEIPVHPYVPPVYPKLAYPTFIHNEPMPSWPWWTSTAIVPSALAMLGKNPCCPMPVWEYQPFCEVQSA